MKLPSSLDFKTLWYLFLCIFYVLACFIERYTITLEANYQLYFSQNFSSLCKFRTVFFKMLLSKYKNTQRSTTFFSESNSNKPIPASNKSLHILLNTTLKILPATVKESKLSKITYSQNVTEQQILYTSDKLDTKEKKKKKKTNKQTKKNKYTRHQKRFTEITDSLDQVNAIRSTRSIQLK